MAEKLAITGKWPYEKQRRCKIDWFETMQPEKARNQITYERAATASSAYSAGYTFDELAIAFDVTNDGARFLVEFGRAIESYPCDENNYGVDDIIINFKNRFMTNNTQNRNLRKLSKYLDDILMQLSALEV